MPACAAPLEQQLTAVAPVPVRLREGAGTGCGDLAPLGFEDIAAEGEEFALVMIRRVDGNVVVLGEVADLPLVEKVGKKLVA